jgi:murein L,D-transpeptidase YafK
MNACLYIVLLLFMTMSTADFKAMQLKNSRVKQAYDEKEGTIKKHFADKKLNYPGFQLFIRAFKKEMKLEAWVKEKGKQKFNLLVTYDFCTTSGKLGPKRQEGDLQIPEGVYHVSHFNPLSKFHLAVGVSYPNTEDKKYGDPVHPGGAIYIHGDCVSTGCIPINDERIKELYLLAVEARNNGQEKIPIHIFPTRMKPGSVTKLITEENADPMVKEFWKNLQPIYLNFEKSKTLSEQ